jgi:hypothetical protein
MLQMNDAQTALVETTSSVVANAMTTTPTFTTTNGLTNGWAQNTGGILNPTVWYNVPWSNYAVYVCTDKTKKAIEVLKALEADGLKVQSVPKFIKLVEKIAEIL